MSEPRKKLIEEALQRMREAYARIVYLGLMTKLRLRAMREKDRK